MIFLEASECLGFAKIILVQVIRMVQLRHILLSTICKPPSRFLHSY